MDDWEASKLAKRALMRERTPRRQSQWQRILRSKIGSEAGAGAKHGTVSPREVEQQLPLGCPWLCALCAASGECQG